MVQDDKAKDAEKRQNTTNKKINNSVIYRTHHKYNKDYAIRKSKNAPLMIAL